jgi:hypothetical protein
MSHSSMRSQQEVLRVQRQGRRAMAQASAYARRVARAQYAKSRRQAAERRRQELINSLYAATSEPLDCVPCEHPSGARSLLFGRNWVDSEKVDHVVLHCNTMLPGSGRPAALLFWDGKTTVQWIDLVTSSLADLTKRGRVFLYPATLALPGGDAFAVLPAQFEGDDEVVGHWSFPTVGSYRGNAFYVLAGSYGTFVDSRLRDYLIARPQTYSDKDHTWVWSGRSSVSEENKLVILATSPFDRSDVRIRFVLPPMKANQPVAALRCSARDDLGDPMAIVDMKAGRRHLLVAREDSLYLLCRPNRKTGTGVPLLVVPTQRAEDGTMVFAGSGPFRGQDVPFEIEANDEDSAGRALFVARANAVVDKQPMVAIALRKLTPDELGTA